MTLDTFIAHSSFQKDSSNSKQPLAVSTAAAAPLGCAG